MKYKKVTKRKKKKKAHCMTNSKKSTFLYKENKQTYG